MKTRYLIRLMLIISILLIYNSCYKDKGNYDYIESDELIITAEPLIRTCYVGEPYIHNPTIIFKNEKDSTNFEYWWEYKGGYDGIYDTICFGRILNFIPEVLGSMDLVFCARNIKTGIIYTDGFILQTSSAIAKGWLFMSENSGKSILHFIRPTYEYDENGESVRKYIVYKDVYNDMYPEHDLGNNPINVHQLLNAQSSLIFINQESGAVYLNGSTYNHELDLYKEFVGEKYPDNFELKDFLYGNRIDLLLTKNGELYTRNYMGSANSQSFFTTYYSNFPTRYNGEVIKIESLIRTMPTSAGFSGLYDKENKRILWIVQLVNGVGIILPSVYAEEDNADYINLNNIQDWELVFSGTTGEYSSISTLLTIFRKDGEIRMQKQTTQITTSPFIVTIYDIESRTMPGGEFLKDNSVFHLLSTRPYLFFSSDNTIYWYDIAARTTYPLYELPENSRIVKMDANPQESELGVALENGKFYVLNIQNDKLHAAEKIWETDGLNKIVDLIYKYPTFSDYTSREVYAD